MKNKRSILILSVSITIILSLVLIHDYKKPDCADAQSCINIPTGINAFNACAWYKATSNESNGVWYICPFGKTMRGRRHVGDENKETWYYCCLLTLS